ncbi:ABC transporter substrate-binding protein [Chlamydiifrater phoenicopteri]|uniref:ABC transporter substrate-binding protein n=1 Tax=Chlamydiifrater phoenicopteri TaxID=2681469 RepID=UPI001BCECC64|nr:ABC transporter substrate-binding protein [Chlamydiifrater phoenicopteri]
MNRESSSFLSLRGLTFFSALVAAVIFFGVPLPWQQKKTFRTAINAKPNFSTLTIALCDTPETMHPHEARRALDLSLIRQLFEGLVRENPKAPEGTELASARSIHISEDKKCYTFKLKKTFWSNGEAVTSHDFLESWAQAVKLSLFSTLFEDIQRKPSNNSEETIKKDSLELYAPDPETFIVYLKQPQPDFLKKISSPTFFPIYQGSTKKLVSNGAYRLHTLSSAHSIILEKNPFYHDTQINACPYINLSVIFNIQTASRLLEKHSIHWLGQPWNQSLPNEIKKRLKQKKLLQNTHSIKGSFWLTINSERMPLENIALRKALSESINRANLVEYVLTGNQSPASTLSPTSLSNASPILQKSTPSLDLPPFQRKITLTYPSDILQCVRIAEFLQQEWKTHLGLNVGLKGVEYRRLIEERNKKHYDIITQTGTALHPGEKGFHPIIAKQFYELYPEARTTIPGDMSADYQEKILLDNHIVIPLYHLSQEFFLSTPIKNIIFCSDGSVDLKYAEFCTKG